MSDYDPYYVARKTPGAGLKDYERQIDMAGLRRYRVLLRCEDPAVGSFSRSAYASEGVAIFEELGAGAYEIEWRSKRFAVRVPGPEVTIE